MPELPEVEEARRIAHRVAVGRRITEVECAALMRDHTTRHLLVEEKGQVVGVVSMRDIIQLMLDEKQFLIEQLHTYIEGR